MLSGINSFDYRSLLSHLPLTPRDARTIPESYLFLREVRRVPFGVQFGDGRELADLASEASIT
jgi:L-fuculose-phosphate aldolase